MAPDRIADPGLSDVRVIRDRPRSVDLDEFLRRPLFAYLGTSSEHGARVSPVWFLWESEQIWIIGTASDSFPARIQRDPRCSLAIVDFDRTSGLVQHVGIRGRATVEPFEIDRAKRILRRYLGPREEHWDADRFVEPYLGEPGDVLILLIPETVVARDQSYRPSPDIAPN